MGCLHFLCNMACRGGGEHSSITLMRLLRNNVELKFWPLTKVDKSWIKDLESIVGSWSGNLDNLMCGPSDSVFIYANDWVYRVAGDSHKWQRRIGGAKNVQVALNFVIGGITKLTWLADKLIAVYFLNYTKEGQWMRSVCGTDFENATRVVLPPPVHLDSFLNAERNGNGDVIVVGRLGGSANKLPNDALEFYKKIISSDPRIRLQFMPQADALRPLESTGRVRQYSRDEIPVINFLSSTDIFAYPVSDRVSDQGPRVVMEAMAAGCAVVAENRDGARDRIKNGDSGILVSSRVEMIKAIYDLAKDDARRIKYGASARARASQWKPEHWVEQILEYARI